MSFKFSDKFSVQAQCLGPSSLHGTQRNSFFMSPFQPRSYAVELVTIKEMTFLFPFPHTFVFLVTGQSWVLMEKLLGFGPNSPPFTFSLYYPIPLIRSQSIILPLISFRQILRCLGQQEVTEGWNLGLYSRGQLTTSWKQRSLVQLGTWPGSF